MNIFAIDNDPSLAANLCNKHIVKMPLETAQILCTVANQRGYKAHYKSTHEHHPAIKWAALCSANWAWLVQHGLELCYQYTIRYGKIHKCQAIIEQLRADENLIWPQIDHWDNHTPFAQCMPEQYKCPDDPVLAYRRYYVGDKIRFAKWKEPSNPPEWFMEMTHEIWS